MGKTFKNMHSFMACSDKEFARSYWHHKGVELGEKKPKVIHKPRHQLTIVEALREVDPEPAEFQTMTMAFISAKRGK